MQQLVAALRTHAFDAEVQQFALGALLQLLVEPEQLAVAAALDAAALGEAARAAFPAHLEVQRLGSRLLQQLGSRTAEPEPEVCVCVCVSLFALPLIFSYKSDTTWWRTAGAGCRCLRWGRQQHPNSPGRRVTRQVFHGRGAGAGVH